MKPEKKTANKIYDVVIIGGGPAGASLAINLRRENRDVLIIEKSDFPRHHVGESMTGESAELLRQMGLGDYMESAKFPVKKGVWVQGAKESSKFWVPVQQVENNGDITPTSTFQVRRAEFDKKLLETAIERGATLLKAQTLKVVKDDDRVTGVMVKTSSGKHEIISGKIVADASGKSCFFGKQGMLGKNIPTGYEQQIALYAYAKGVKRDPAPGDGNTLLFYGGTDHWTWLIPFDDEVTSLGVVVPIKEFRESGLDAKEFFYRCVDNINPNYRKRLDEIELVSEIYIVSNYSYRFEKLTGPGFVSIGDSHGFLDPIFAFGLHFAIKEGVLAANAIEQSLQENSDCPLQAFEANTNDAHDIVRMVIDTFWQYPLAFLRLTHYSHINDIAYLFSGRLFDPRIQDLEAVKLMKELFDKPKIKSA